ncbi:MAG: hypothetical protein ABSH53_16685 [Holophaga sp.]
MAPSCSWPRGGPSTPPARAPWWNWGRWSSPRCRRWTGSTRTSWPGTFTANIKQVKNKIIGRNTGAVFSVSLNFRQRVQTDNFDRAENGKAFITLP